jgi:multiple sugar transport system substrate-binding protein
MLTWNHFIPDHDRWLRLLADQFKRDYGIEVQIDAIGHADLPARLASEAATRSGHDIVMLRSDLAGAYTYAESLADLSDVAELLGKRYGGWFQLAMQSSIVAGSWRAIPYFYLDYPQVYRDDLFRQVGIPQPITWDDVLRAGRDLKRLGFPIGIAISHCNDSVGDLTSLLWSFGGSWVKGDGKTVAINSPQTRRALEFVRRLFDEAMTPEVLAWDDASNNRFILSGKGSWTINGVSIYFAAKRDVPQLAEKLRYALPPLGPAGQYGYATLISYGVWRWSDNLKPAKRFLTYLIDHFEEGFRASGGYNQPLLRSFAKKPMPILGEDPRISALQEYGRIARTLGFPGPPTRAAEEVQARFIIPDMFARAVTGASLQEAIEWAEAEISAIYRKHFR